MSATTDVSGAVAGCHPTTGTPVSIDAASLESTAEPYLQHLKEALDGADYVPAELVVEAAFDADCSLSTQCEADRVRDFIGVAEYIGVGSIRVVVTAVADPGKVEPAIAALRERAQREGLGFTVDSDTHEF